MSARDEYADFRDGFITDDKIADDAVTTYEITNLGLDAIADLLNRLTREQQAQVIQSCEVGREWAASVATAKPVNREPIKRTGDGAL